MYCFYYWEENKDIKNQIKFQNIPGLGVSKL